MRSRIDKGSVAIAVVLLVGVVVLAAGHFLGNRIAFYAGAVIILAGVLTGMQRLTR